MTEPTTAVTPVRALTLSVLRKWMRYIRRLPGRMRLLGKVWDKAGRDWGVVQVAMMTPTGTKR